MILEFDPAIYPTRLWICDVHTTAKEKNDNFYGFNENNEVVEFDDKEYLGTTNADVCKVKSKKNGWYGVLIVLVRNVEGDVYAHEAVHACDALFERLGIKCATFDDDEPRAYYVQWVVRMAMKAVREFRKNGIKLYKRIVWD